MIKPTRRSLQWIKNASVSSLRRGKDWLKALLSSYLDDQSSELIVAQDILMKIRDKNVDSVTIDACVRESLSTSVLCDESVDDKDISLVNISSVVKQRVEDVSALLVEKRGWAPHVKYEGSNEINGIVVCGLLNHALNEVIKVMSSMTNVYEDK